MKNLLYLIILLPILLNAQVGIGTTNPNAKLDIRSSNQATPANNDGLLIPKIDEYPVINPTATQDGMLVFATGNGSVTKGFYYWDNTSTSWVIATGAKKIDDLTDGKSDNNGFSIFLGVDAGLNDDSSNNQNVGIGYQALYSNTIGSYNTSNGFHALYSNTTGYSNTANGNLALRVNTTGFQNTAIGDIALSLNGTGYRNTANGYQSLYNNTTGNFNVALGSKAGSNTNGNRNVFLGYETGSNGFDTKEGSVFIGARAGFNENNSNRLYIENSQTTTPLIYGEFDNDLLRVNGNLEVEKTTDAGITVKSPFGNKSSLKLMETNGTDYGFEFEYDGSADKLNLWSRTFAGNEAQRMTWLKNGNVGISTTAPNALLDVSSSNPAAPKNTDGILVPRIDAFPTTNPGVNQNGMLVFLTTNNTFYYWRQSTTSWNAISDVKKIDDLSDGKSDTNGSSVYLGLDAGINSGSNKKNVGVGYQSLYLNTGGSTNTAFGYQSLYNNLGGHSNVASGSFSLFSNTSGVKNVANGDSSLFSNTLGVANVANGWETLYNNTTSDGNVANGYRALYSNTTGNVNVANGYEAMRNNITGKDNVANGYKALRGNTVGEFNAANGSGALRENTTGNYNTASGALALNKNTTGNNNTAIGFEAGYNSNGTGNVFIGYKSGSLISSSDRLYIDNSDTFSPLIYGEFDNDLLKVNGNLNVANGARINGDLEVRHAGGTTHGLTIRQGSLPNADQWRIFTSNTGSLVMYANNNLKGVFSSVSGAYTAISDRNLKKNINTLDNVLDKINKLNVVDYNFIDQKTEDKHVGFIAQEVNKIFPHLVNKPIKEGEDKGYYTMDYSGFGILAIKAIQEQQKQIETLKKEIQEIKNLLKNKK